MLISDHLNLAEVFNMIRGQDPACRGCRHLRLLGHPMCNKGFMRLLGIGKGRFRGFMDATRHGHETCPLDGRYMPGSPKKQSEKRAAVYDWLHNLYTTAGETLPDSNHTSSNKRPRHGKFKFDDENMDRSKLRHLPPGKFSDYFRLCSSDLNDIKISRKLFVTVGNPVFML